MDSRTRGSAIGAQWDRAVCAQTILSACIFADSVKMDSFLPLWVDVLAQFHQQGQTFFDLIIMCVRDLLGPDALPELFKAKFGNRFIVKISPVPGVDQTLSSPDKWTRLATDFPRMAVPVTVDHQWHRATFLSLFSSALNRLDDNGHSDSPHFKAVRNFFEGPSTVTAYYPEKDGAVSVEGKRQLPFTIYPFFDVVFTLFMETPTNSASIALFSLLATSSVSALKEPTGTTFYLSMLTLFSNFVFLSRTQVPVGDFVYHRHDPFGSPTHHSPTFTVTPASHASSGPTTAPDTTSSVSTLEESIDHLEVKDQSAPS